MTDEYEPISLIGKGNFGSISKIRRKRDGKILVWKELNYGSMKEKYKRHISSEINILKELHHPNIVKYYDRLIDKENTKIYIIMEYCPGGDLSQLIKKYRQSKQYISEDNIWKIFSQVVSALYACHTNKNGKILHRDIKPSNVFLDNDNNVKLGDFGLSLMLNKEMNFAYSNVGTPYYMSPEQVDENKYNEKSDIWSLGCFLYELAALHPPFEAHNHLSLALKIKSGKLEKLPDKYSDNLCKVIFWMINVDQEKRPTIKDIIMLPEVSIRIREKKIKDTYQKLKKYENELKLREENLIENEKKLKIKEKFLEEKEKNLIQRENYVKMKEEELKFNNSEGIDNLKKSSNNNLFITSGGFDIKGINDDNNDINDINDINDNYNDNENNNNDIIIDEELNSIKNIPVPNDKKYLNKQNMNSMNESIPKIIDKKYSNTIRRSLINDISQNDIENNKVQNSRDNSFFSHKVKNNFDMNINSNSYKNLLTNNYNSNKNNNINSINFNNSNNSLSKINSNKNLLDNYSKVISFNSELNCSSNDEKAVKSNNINTSNINSLGYLSINSQENNTMMYNNSNNNINMNMNMKGSNKYPINQNNRQSSSTKHYNKNKNSFMENNNMDYKSGSTNFFSSIPRTSGESYNENNMNEGINSSENRNYNSYNVKNSQISDNKNSLNINHYRDNYRMLKNENAKKSKRRLNIEYNKKFDSENNDDFDLNEVRKNNKNYFNKYIPNNFRNNSFGKKNNEQNNSENSLNIKNIRHQKKYMSNNSTNVINFNHNDNNNKIGNLKLSPQSCRIDDNFAMSNDENNSRNTQDKIKYFKNDDIFKENNYNKHKNGKNINYNNMINNSNRDMNPNKNKNYVGSNAATKRKKFESNSNRYINTINNKEKNYFQF